MQTKEVNITFLPKQKLYRFSVKGKSKYFKTFKAAFKYKRSLAKEVLKPCRLNTSHEVPARGESGIKGVSLATSHGSHIGYIAKWMEGKQGKRKQKYKYFLFSEWGSRALIKAAQCRKRMYKANSLEMQLKVIPLRPCEVELI